MLLGFILFFKLEMKKHYFSCLQKDISQIHFKILNTGHNFCCWLASHFKYFPVY